MFRQGVFFLALILACFKATCADSDSPEAISQCDHPKKLPYRVIIHSDGTVELNCRFLDCFNASNRDDPKCDESYHLRSCNRTHWLCGVRQPTGPRGPALQTKCCNTGRLQGRQRGNITLRRNQGFLGGFGYLKGQPNKKRDGFDFITNITKEGNVYRIWVYRIACIGTANQDNDYFDTNQGKDSSIDYQTIQGDNGPAPQNAPAQSVHSAPAAHRRGCFEPKTIVHSETRGPIPISDLQVGENVLTVHGKTSSYRPVSFFVHRDPNFTTRYLTLHTEGGGHVTMTPRHITFSGPCNAHPWTQGQKFAEEVSPGHCLVTLAKHSGQLENVRVTNVSESYISGIYSPITPNGVIITNDLVSSCYSFIKNQDLQATIFLYMQQVEEFVHNYFPLVSRGWLLGGQQTKVDVPRVLDYMMGILDNILPLSKIF